MPKFIIHYFFDGRGVVVIEADTKDKAEELFFDGDFENENESRSDNYEIDRIIENPICS